MSDKDLKGKVVVITGASSGFGKGAARKFAEKGARVILAARRKDLLDALAKELKGSAIAVPTDVGNEDEMQALARTALDLFGRIDVWINNAGVGAVGRFEETPLEDHRGIVQTNLVGTIIGSHLALNQFRKQGSGILINVASVLGKIPAPYYASYTATKYGVVGLSAALRQELNENGLGKKIHVCTVLPMAMDTPFFAHAANYTGRKSVPIPPVYPPEYVIDAFLHLSTNPRPETIVGKMGKSMAVFHDYLPEGIEKVMGKETHIVQIKKGQPAPNKAGSILRTVPEGREVSDGWLKEKKKK